MQGYSTSTFALAFFCVAIFSNSYLVYKFDTITNESGHTVLYQAFVGPSRVCLEAFVIDTDPPTVYDWICSTTLTGGRLSFPQVGVYFPFSNTTHPASFSDADTSKIRSVLAFLIIAGIAAALSYASHYEYAQRRLRGYASTFSFLHTQAAAMPLMHGHSFADDGIHHHVAVPTVPSPSVMTVAGGGDSNTLMPCRIFFTVAICDAVAGQLVAFAPYLMTPPYKRYFVSRLWCLGHVLCH